MSLARRLFGCEAGEGLPVLWLGLVFFAVKAAAGLAETYADAAFLKRFGVEWLPHVYLANAVFVFVFLNAIGVWVDRVARWWFLVGLFLAVGRSGWGDAPWNR